jgi:hypothetical protein
MRILQWIWAAWKETAAFIGDFQARWLLTTFYFTVVVPFGLLARLVIDPLVVSRAPQRTGWQEREPSDPRGMTQAGRQF